jgi:putative transcriptional regulator
MRELDAMCLTPVEKLTPAEIRTAHASARRSHELVFAHYLNVSKSIVRKWERGNKEPDGASLKLLKLVRTQGLKAIA